MKATDLETPTQDGNQNGRRQQGQNEHSHEAQVLSAKGNVEGGAANTYSKRPNGPALVVKRPEPNRHRQKQQRQNERRKLLVSIPALGDTADQAKKNEDEKYHKAGLHRDDRRLGKQCHRRDD